MNSKTNTQLLVAAAFLGLAVYYFALVTAFEFKIVSHELGMSTYGSMWEHLRHGQFDIDKDHNPERMWRDGKNYTYFGIFPAIPRGLLTPFYTWEKPVGRIPCFFLAFGIALLLIGIARVFDLHEGLTRKWYFLLVLIFALATPPVAALGPSNVYHEAILWSAFFNLLFTYLFFKTTLKKDENAGKYFIFMCLIAGLIFNTRVPMGISPALVLFFLSIIWLNEKLGLNKAAVVLFDRISMRAWSTGILVFTALFCFMFFVNYEKFGNPLSFTPAELHEGYNEKDPKRLQTYQQNGMLAFDRIPLNLEYYFLPHRDNLVRHWPHLRSSTTLYLKPFSRHGIDYYEAQTQFPISLYSPLLVILAVIGFISKFRTSKRPLHPLSKSFFNIWTFCYLGNTVFLLMFCGQCMRYEIDFLPHLGVLACMGLFFWKNSPPDERILKNARLFKASAALTVASVVATMFVNFNYKMSDQWKYDQSTVDRIKKFLPY